MYGGIQQGHLPNRKNKAEKNDEFTEEQLVNALISAKTPVNVLDSIVPEQEFDIMTRTLLENVQSCDYRIFNLHEVYKKMKNKDLENAIGFLDGVTYGDILSGGSVMSSFKEKDRICLGYTKADYIIGGEMEGNAVFQYAKKVDIPGVVIKGICDWGVAKNGIFPDDPEREDLFKDSLQAFAMRKAVKKCKALFNDKEIFSSPKNVALKKLREKYLFCKWGLIASQLVMIINGLYLLLCRENYGIRKPIDVNCEFFINPSVWLAIPFIFMVIFLLKVLINTIPKLLWRVRACLKKYL